MPTTSPTTVDAALEAHVFWIRFKKEIAAVLIIAVLTVAGFSGYRFYSEKRNATAARALASAKNPAAYQEVIDRYPNTPAGASAYLLLAEAHRKEKKLA